MPPKKFTGKFWQRGADPVDLDVEFLGSGVLRADPVIANGDGLIYLETEVGRSYALGEWIFKAGRGGRPDLVAVTDSASQAGRISIESSALNRLQGLLQRDGTLTFQVRHGDRVVEATVVPISSDNPSAIFMGTLSQPTILSGSDTIVVADVLGMAFTFKAKVLDQEGTTVVMTLPSAAVRSIRRFTNRSSRPIPVYIEAPIQTEGTVENHSTLGLAVYLPDVAASLPVGEELRLRFQGADGESIQSHALIVSSSPGRVHLLLAGGETSVKARFYALMGLSQEQLKFEESAADAWDCLDRFKYLDLIEGRVLEQVKADCIRAWDSLREDYRAFQPVVKLAGEPVGTIGAIQVTSDHWVPHSLATKVDPALVNVTSSLYMSWPNYLLSLAKPLWMSTWYDANKKWHNRFYQVFIKEHERDPDVVSFVRQFFVSATLKEYPDSTSRVNFEFIDANQPNRNFFENWILRYGKMTRSPVLRTLMKNDYIFQERFASIHMDGQVIGTLRTVNSEMDVNPFSVLQIAHVNLFHKKSSSDPAAWKTIAEACSALFLGEGNKRAAITIDFDAPEGALSGTCFVPFGDMRCLSCTSQMLPGLSSNNALSFADMLARNRVG